MPVLSTTPDTADLSLTIVAELAAPPSRVWHLWVDPRQLERWWGPPTWPATFVQHDVTVGGTSRYYMTGPEGEQAHGWWRFLTLDEPNSREVEDGFGDSPEQAAEGGVQARGGPGHEGAAGQVGVTEVGEQHRWAPHRRDRTPP